MQHNLLDRHTYTTCTSLSNPEQAVSSHPVTWFTMCVEDEHGVRRMCAVKQINASGFQSYNFQKKTETVKHGPPRPALPALKTERNVKRNGKTTSFKLNFQKRTYELHPWICGCPAEDGGLFCWPCLLFNSSPVRAWKNKGYKDLNNLSGEISRHSKLQSHLEAVVCLANFGRSRNRIELQVDLLRSRQVQEHNEKV